MLLTKPLAQALMASCEIASKLSGALTNCRANSRANPITAARIRYKEEEEALLGDALAAAALVTYAGSMDEASRDCFMQV
jgi:hypothetical protein